MVNGAVREASVPVEQDAICRVLVAGVGNLLRGDDGFGVEVVRRLRQRGDLPTGVRIIEVGIGGMSLVQELFDGYDVVLIIDAVDRGGAPGTVYLLEQTVPTLDHLAVEQRHDFLADMHLATPSRALILARALGVLPRRVYLLGCQPTTAELAIGLSDAVRQVIDPCVERLIRELHRLVERVPPPCHSH